MTEFPVVVWLENDAEHVAVWRSESGIAPPTRVLAVDDRLTADAAYRLVCEGTYLLWRGDFQNARQLLQALARRIDRKPHKKSPEADPSNAFHRQRQAQARRARLLGMLLLPFDADYRLPLRRAPEVRQACEEAYGAPRQAFVASLRELQGVIGAHEWRKNGVEIPALKARIHPHYGVFSPVRGEYVDLVATAPLPPGALALAIDIGTGTGVLAAVLVRRGVARVIATEREARALACARQNMLHLGMAAKVDVQEMDLFPTTRAALVVCNPPWVPARANSPLEQAVYDPESRMLRGFLAGLTAHLLPGGEGWLILSDLAEHLGLRSRDELLALIDSAGLRVIGRMDVRPRHPRSTDATDPLHLARAAELTSLWRLAAR